MRYFSSIAGEMTLTSGVNDSTPALLLNTVSGLPTSAPFTLILEPGTTAEEVVNVTSIAGLTVTVDRGWSGTSAKAHLAGAVVRHGIASQDIQPLHQHVDETSAHGLTGGAAVVGTTQAQVLTNKTIDGAANTITALPTTAYGDSTITLAKMADASVGTAELVNLAVTEGKIAANAVSLAKLAAAIQEALVPTGTVAATARATAPTGWLLCDGAAVSRTTYAALFAAIGTAYGTGDGTTTFNLPDLRGRVAVGLKAGETEFDTLAETGGSRTHTHTLSDAGQARIMFSVGGGPNTYIQRVTTTTYSATQEGTISSPASSSGSASSGAALAGATDAGSTLQPYQVLNYMIRL